MLTPKKLLIFFAVLFSLPSCAQRWAKPGGTDAEFQVTRSSCEARSFSQFPPFMQSVQVGQGYTTPISTQCTGWGPNVNCYTTGGQYVPPTFVNVDRNSDTRRRAVSACLMQNGWTPVDEKGNPVQLRG
jgi:hypothetical protein